ncbi:uncharacterized protein DEA37_0002337 [Paragonimus westermani]|uniref:Tc1-like transposase DDE domain-containing protein n=1 Tax=Paragonimus westermani TaxID=34504 RepID=A0A5J4N2F7_9TREM|nr:uncharacterized protein DEA37_0002337 [Paragonimus westermani]
MSHRKELTDFEKGVIYGCYLSGKTQSETVSLTGHPKGTIDKFLRKYRQTGTHVNKPRSGRPPILTNRGERRLKRLVSTNRRQSLSDLTSAFNAGPDRVSIATARRVLHRHGFFGRFCARKPLISEIIRKRRLRWCRERRNWTAEQWRSVIWSDESRFTLFKADGRETCFRRVGERFHPNCIQPTVKYGGGSIMFWSYFTSSGTGPLVKCSNHMTSAEYRQILENELVPFLPEMAGLVFQQDNAPIHTSHAMTDFFREHGIRVLDWVPQSPDLNPIEFLWDVVGRQVRKRSPTARTIAQLECHLHEEWSRISPQFLLRVVDSMTKRVRMVIRMKGNVTKY